MLETSEDVDAMPNRPLIFGNSQQLEVKMSVQQTGPQQKIRSRMELDRRLRQKRSQRYIDAMAKLDAGGHVSDRAVIEEFINILREEFPDVDLPDLPIGYIAKCHLGEPYEVHTLDRCGRIITHFKTCDSLPPAMERARGLAIHGGYLFIEVYTDSLRAVKQDGTVAVIR